MGDLFDAVAIACFGIMPQAHFDMPVKVGVGTAHHELADLIRCRVDLGQ